MNYLREKRLCVLIPCFLFFIWVSPSSGEDLGVVGPNDVNSKIATNKTTIEFGPDDISKSFQVWNTGAGRLSYTLRIDGNDADYFSLNKATGDSNDENYKQTHIVTLDYGQPLDRILDANIIITNDNNNLIALDINLIARPAEEPNNIVTSPVIGVSVNRISLRGKVMSKRFQVWNKGTGTLNYNLDITGVDSDYFTLSETSGDSNGRYDKKTYTIDVNYGDSFHNGTLNATIEITDVENNKSTIELTASETIASRVSYFNIEQGVDYDAETETYDFLLYIDTDSTVAEINITTPESSAINLADLDYTENDDGSIRYWTFFEPEADLLNYGDGRYTIEVLYTNDETAQTSVNFGIPNKSGTIPWPTQLPVLISPGLDEQTVSPVRFEWEKCDDANTRSIRLYLENADSNIFIGREYGKTASRTSGYKLETGNWSTELDFGRWHQAYNDDDIEYEVGKCSRGYSNFEIMKWFGTMDDGTNNVLRLNDCNGTEVAFRLTGGGFGEIDDINCGFGSITLTGTNNKSILSITTKNVAKTEVGNINIDSNIRAINAKDVNLQGNIIIDGAAGAITLNNITDSNITISEKSPLIKSCVLKFNNADDLNMISLTPVSSLQANRWSDGDLNTTWISSMTIRGGFGANLKLNGLDSPKGMTLKSARVAGSIDGIWNIDDGNCGSITFASSTGDFNATINGDIRTITAAGNRKQAISSMLSGTWQFASARTITAADIEQCDIEGTQTLMEDKPVIGRITVNGWINDCNITIADGNIGSISAGAFKNCAFSAGGTIDKIANRGLRNEAYCFINSNVTAQHISSAIIGYPKCNNGNVSFGLTAGTIDKLTIRDSLGRRTWTDDEIGDGITIGDMEINRPE